MASRTSNKNTSGRTYDSNTGVSRNDRGGYTTETKNRAFPDVYIEGFDDLPDDWKDRILANPYYDAWQDALNGRFDNLWDNLGLSNKANLRTSELETKFNEYNSKVLAEYQEYIQKLPVTQVQQLQQAGQNVSAADISSGNSATPREIDFPEGAFSGDNITGDVIGAIASIVSMVNGVAGTVMNSMAQMAIRKVNQATAKGLEIDNTIKKIKSFESAIDFGKKLSGLYPPTDDDHDTFTLFSDVLDENGDPIPDSGYNGFRNLYSSFLTGDDEIDRAVFGSFVSPVTSNEASVVSNDSKVKRNKASLSRIASDAERTALDDEVLSSYYEFLADLTRQYQIIQLDSLAAEAQSTKQKAIYENNLYSSLDANLAASAVNNQNSFNSDYYQSADGNTAAASFNAQNAINAKINEAYMNLKKRVFERIQYLCEQAAQGSVVAKAELTGYDLTALLGFDTVNPNKPSAASSVMSAVIAAGGH